MLTFGDCCIVTADYSSSRDLFTVLVGYLHGGVAEPENIPIITVGRECGVTCLWELEEVQFLG